MNTKAATKRRKRHIEDVVKRVTGTDEWGDGSTSPPGEGWTLPYGEQDGDRPMYIAQWKNDGTELWLGTPHNWYTHMRRSDARKLAWHIIGCDFRLLFGLRRKLWYWGLRKGLKRSGLYRKVQR